MKVKRLYNLVDTAELYNVPTSHRQTDLIAVCPLPAKSLSTSYSLPIQSPSPSPSPQFSRQPKISQYISIEVTIELGAK